MECLYVPELYEEQRELTIVGSEFLHLKALRLREGDSVMLSNGKGLCAICHLLAFRKHDAAVLIKEVLPMYGEGGQNIGLAIGILDNRDRMEYVIEKAVELGVQQIYPLITRFAQRRSVTTSRLESKAIAALKQCKRAVLPTIHEAMKIEQFFQCSEYENLVLCDAEGTSPKALHNSLHNSVCIMVGPEGGFSTEELQLLRQHPSVLTLKLAPRRLRADTAAVAALSVVTAAAAGE